MRPPVLGVWLATVLVGVLLASHTYSKGFFLTRYELRAKTQGSALQPQFQQAVLLLVDALRYDFANSTESTGSSYYVNRLPIVQSTLRTQPTLSRLFRFIADPPTVTMQRIKGLMTGSLPTFIDFKDNFHSNAIEEDSLLGQCKALGRRTLFAGDDTWLGLFPADFTTAYPFDSFNVRDLDTVDKGVREHLLPAVSQGNYTLLIGHMLGVDHVGHRYYANHPEMARKLSEVNDFIEELMRELPADSLLLVFGDHGMTEDGNHGGTSELETDSVLFAYSKRQFSQEIPVARSRLFQIDLVPTLSVLLGLPIPFNNLGSPILELFLEEKLALPALSATAKQVYTYLNTYNSQIQSLPDPQFDNLQDEFALLSSQYAGNGSNPDLVTRFYAWISSAAEMCRGIWTTFDLEAMEHGALELAAVTVLSALYVLQMPRDENILWTCGLAWAVGLYAGLDWSLGVVLAGWLVSKKQSLRVSDLFPTLILHILHSYCLFSNSYIVQEDAAVRFLAQFVLFYCYFTSINKPTEWKRYLLCAGLVRFSAALDPVHQKSNLDYLDRLLMLNIVRLYTPLLGLIVILWKTDLHFLRKSTLMVSFLLVAGHWLFQDTAWAEWTKLLLPRVIYALGALLCLSNSPTSLYHALQPVLCLLGGPEFPIVLLCVRTQVHMYEKLMRGRRSALSPLFLYLSVLELFYSTGHRCSFPSLQITAAFTGFEVFNIYISGSLLLLNTVSCLLLVLRAYETAAPQRSWTVLSVALCFQVSLLMTTLNTYVNRRHLMVWPIFAPKYIFDLGITALGLGLLTVVAVVSRAKAVKETD